MRGLLRNGLINLERNPYSDTTFSVLEDIDDDSLIERPFY